MRLLKTTSLVILSVKIKNLFENLEDSCWRESPGYKYDKAAYEASFFFPDMLSTLAHEPMKE